MPKQTLLKAGGGKSKERERGKEETKKTKQEQRQPLLAEPKERRGVTKTPLSSPFHTSNANSHTGRSELRTSGSTTRRRSRGGGRGTCLPLVFFCTESTGRGRPSPGFSFFGASV